MQTAASAANTISYAKFYSRSHRAVIRVYDHAGNVMETQEQAGRSESRRRNKKSSVGWWPQRALTCGVKANAASGSFLERRVDREVGLAVPVTGLGP